MLWIVLASVALSRVVAQPRLDAPDPLDIADPLELARVVERLGDDFVLSRLEQSLEEDADPALALTTVRAARWVRAPELTLGPLARLAAGRDPTLAPMAMRVLAIVAGDLTRAGLDAREADDTSVRAGLEVLRTLAADPEARTDVRRAAEWACALLGDLVSSSE